MVLLAPVPEAIFKQRNAHQLLIASFLSSAALLYWNSMEVESVVNYVWSDDLADAKTLAFKTTKKNMEKEVLIKKNNQANSGRVIPNRPQI